MTTEFTELIKSEKPNLSPNSVKQYVRCLILLHNALAPSIKESSNYAYLKDKEKVATFLGKYSFTTARNYYTAIITLLETETPRDKVVINDYKTIVKQLNNKYTKQNETGVISDKDNAALNGEFKNSKEKLDQLITLLDNDPVDKANNKMGYILFRLLYHHHIRNEIAELIRIPLMKYKKLKKEDKYYYKNKEDEKEDKNRIGKNYLVVGSKKLFIARTGYKTEKKYGEIIFDITDKQLIKELRTYLETLKTDEVFTFPEGKSDAKVSKRTQLTNYMIYVSKKHIGMKISTTLLAKIMMSHKYADNKLKQEKTAKERGHSINVENLVYVKRPQ